jgi:hypothetical protein
MIFASLVVLWLLILVPAVARRRQEVARPSVAALSGRVLERSGRRQAPATGCEREVGGMDEVSREDPDADGRDDAPGRADLEDDRAWERPPPRYRPGRGGFDPEAAALAARARYAFRQRVVLGMLVAAIATGVVAAVAVPALWWPHIATDLALVGYLIYLRRQVRLEEAIRERRAARMAGTRRMAAADDPELDTWARRGRDLTRRETDAPYGEHDDGHDDYGPDDHRSDEWDHLDEHDDEHDDERDDGRHEPAAVHDDEADERPVPEDVEPALPRMHPAPPPALPAGTSLVEVDEDDPELYDLDGPARPDYRRAAGE